MVTQQQTTLDDLVTSCVEDVGIIGPHIVELIENMDTSTHVISGRLLFHYHVFKNY